jgi:anti-sigma factor RsiW
MNQTSHDHALSLGPCADQEFELVELHAGELEAERSLALRQHIEHCPRCRAYLAALDELDVALAQAVPSLVPSPGFDARLQARIAELDRAPTRAAALAAAERERELMLQRLGRGLGWSTALNALALAPVVLGILFAFSLIAPELLAAVGVTAAGTSPVLASSLVLGAVFAAAGLLYARSSRAGGPALPG